MDKWCGLNLFLNVRTLAKRSFPIRDGNGNSFPSFLGLPNVPQVSNALLMDLLMVDLHFFPFLNDGRLRFDSRNIAKLNIFEP